MKKFAFAACTALFAATFSFGADGATLFKSCVACHGAAADRPYLGGKVPALKSIASAERLESLKGYKAGTLNKYGQGAIMKAQTARLSEEDLAAINAYIDSL